jgi:hypothetical protein
MGSGHISRTPTIAIAMSLKEPCRSERSEESHFFIRMRFFAALRMTDAWGLREVTRCPLFMTC